MNIIPSIPYAEFLGRFNVKQLIGEGSYGKVYRVYDKVNDTYMALKKIELHKYEQLSLFLRQIQIQKFLEHPLVLRIFEYYVHQVQDRKTGRKRTQVGIISQLGKGSLHHLIKSKSESLTIDEIIIFAFSFTKLFAYFQSEKIVHRDIKPQNFVRMGPGLNCRLIDFGLCTHINDLKGVAGSFCYLSPKLKRMHTNRELIGKIKTNPFKDDVYSFGLTLYEIITKKTPHYKGDVVNLTYCNDIFHCTRNQKLSEIIYIMLEYEQDNRPDFHQLEEIFKKYFNFYEQYEKEQENIRMQQNHSKTIKNEQKQQKKQIERDPRADRYQQKTIKRTNEPIYQNNRTYKENGYNENDYFQQQYEYDENGNIKYERRQIEYVDPEHQEMQMRQMNKANNYKQEEPTANTSHPTNLNNQYYQHNQFINNNNQNDNNYLDPVPSQYSQQYYQQQPQTISIDRTITNVPQNNTQVLPEMQVSNQNHQQLNNQNNCQQVSFKSVYYQANSIPTSQNQPIQYQQNQFTQQKYKQNESRLFKRIYSLPPWVVVTATIFIKDFIICGCQDGSIQIIHTTSQKHKNIFKIQNTKYTHNSAIAALSKDKNGKLWSMSVDGTILIWDRQILFTQLINQNLYKEQDFEVIDQQGRSQIYSRGYIKIDPNVVQKINTPNKPQLRVTCLYCQNQTNFIVGYNNGWIFIVWGDVQIDYLAHQDQITCIKIFHDYIMTSSLDGTVRFFNIAIRQFKPQYFKCRPQIRAFGAYGNLDAPRFTVISTDGRGFIMTDWQLSPEQQGQVPNDPVLTTAAFYLSQTVIFTLSQNGILYRNGTQLERCQGSGWCSLAWNNATSIVMGSNQGKLCLLQQN